MSTKFALAVLGALVVAPRVSLVAQVNTHRDSSYAQTYSLTSSSGGTYLPSPECQAVSATANHPLPTGAVSSCILTDGRLGRYYNHHGVPQFIGPYNPGNFVLNAAASTASDYSTPTTASASIVGTFSDQSVGQAIASTRTVEFVSLIDASSLSQIIVSGQMVLAGLSSGGVLRNFSWGGSVQAFAVDAHTGVLTNHLGTIGASGHDDSYGMGSNEYACDANYTCTQGASSISFLGSALNSNSIFALVRTTSVFMSGSYATGTYDAAASASVSASVEVMNADDEVTTPEPSEVILLATGMLMLGGVARVRRQRRR